MRSLRRHLVVFLHSIVIFCAFILSESKKCIYHKSPQLELGIDKQVHGKLNVTENDEIYEECTYSNAFCFSLWTKDPKSKENRVIGQGCWNLPGYPACERLECVSNKTIITKIKSEFCCCSPDFCNANFTEHHHNITALPTVIEATSKPTNNSESWKTAIIFACFLGIITITALLFCRFCCRNKKPTSSTLHIIESPQPVSTAFDLSNLKIKEKIGSGNYGSVYHGNFNNNDVAIKIFSSENQKSFLNEKDVYTLPHMEHPCLATFIGDVERKNKDGKPEYMIILTYSSIGCLQNYLRANTINWSVLCRLSHDLAAGLAYLHTEVNKDNQMKPVIAHRDLTSENVLVKDDGGCMICDFGFAVGLKIGRYYQNGEMQIAETTSLADVGTLRYMAPELLQGAVNLTDCESALKQIDIYGLGLILWEIASRCSELFQGMDVPEYKLPYEKEIGLNPTQDKIRVLVSGNHARPLFPDIWKDTNDAIKSLKETIRDCWDQDAEARLTAVCVEERLSQLPPELWERRKGIMNVSGVSPVVNHIKPVSSSDVVINLTEINTSTNTYQQDMIPERAVNDNTRSTSETSITESSPSSSSVFASSASKNSIAKNFSNSSISFSYNVPLQPYQGHNPSMERNLLKEPVRDLVCRGNMLIEKGCVENELSHPIWEQDTFNILHHEDNTERNALVPRNTLEQSSRVYHPIPHVNSSVHTNCIIPKHNLPEISKTHNLFSNISKRQKEKHKCDQSPKTSFKELFKRRRTRSENLEDCSEEKQPLSVNTSNRLSVREINKEDTHCNTQEKNCITSNGDLLNSSNTMTDKDDCPTGKNINAQANKFKFKLVAYKLVNLLFLITKSYL